MRSNCSPVGHVVATSTPIGRASDPAHQTRAARTREEPANAGHGPRANHVALKVARQGCGMAWCGAEGPAHGKLKEVLARRRAGQALGASAALVDVLHKGVARKRGKPCTRRGGGDMVAGCGLSCGRATDQGARRGDCLWRAHAEKKRWPRPKATIGGSTTL